MAIRKKFGLEQIPRTKKQTGAAIRRRRRALTLSQGETRPKTCLRQATISELENGKSGTHLRMLTDVTAALNLGLAIRERSKVTGDIKDHRDQAQANPLPS